MTSTSTLGSTSITLQFDLNRNVDAAAQDVQAAITAAARQLPITLTAPPTYRKVNPADSPILILSAHSDTLPLTVVDDFADNVIAQQISQITGVSQVVIGGEQKPAVRVQVDPAKLQTRGLTFEDVRSVIGVACTNAAKGSINSDQQSFTIRANDQLTKAEEYNDVILAYRNGAPIRVRDVGQAVAGPQDVNVAAYAGQEPAVILLVFKQPGANVIEIVDRIKAAMPKLDSVLPPGMRIDTIIDRTQTIRASVHDVEFTLALTIALVVLVILLFLRDVRATMIPAVTVPLSLLGAVAAMYLLDFSLDNLSLMALTIAVGFVVDDAIVVVENIYRHIEAGMPATASAIKGAREIGFTVLSISILAGRRVHPAAADGRHHRAAVSRIRDHGDGGDRRLGGGLADAHADAVLALPEAAAGASRPHLSRHRMGFRGVARRLSPHARRGVAAPAADAARVLCDLGHHGRDVRLHPERLLSDPGHRPDHGPVRGRTGRLAGGDEAPAAQDRRGARARSRHRIVRIVLRQRLRQYLEHGPVLHRPEAARAAHQRARSG